MKTKKKSRMQMKIESAQKIRAKVANCTYFPESTKAWPVSKINRRKLTFTKKFEKAKQ